MKCIICNVEMRCVDDVNDISTKIDWVVCPVCGTKAEINFTADRKNIEKVIWERNKN